MAKIRDGSTYLSQHLTANDYYSEHESVSGKWIGQGAERLGLNGPIRSDDTAFESLRENRNPTTGEKLTPRDGANRVRFFDFQCSAQKSVSIMAVTMRDGRLLEAHDRAARKAFAELERFAATQCNTVLTRNTRPTGNLIATEFRHTASRALDPQLHSHFVTANATWDETTRSWRALTEIEMVRAIRYAGKCYQNELAKACRKLGYDIEQIRDRRGNVTGFEIIGVSEPVRKRFSKRRAEVEKGIAEFEAKNGRTPTTAEIHAITVQTRDPKLAETTTDAVLSAQRAQLSGLEFERLFRVRENAVQRVPEPPMPTRERESLRIATAHLFERRSVASGHELLAEALNANLGHLDLDKLQQHAADAGLVSLGSKEWLSESFTTERGLAHEQWATNFVRETKDRFVPLGQVDAPAIVNLSPDQLKITEGILASRDQVVSMRGAAGVGKTTTLRALVQCLESSGAKVSVCAPTSSAADTLRSEKVVGATTVSAFLLRSLAHGGVWVVDEAGLASNRQGVELLQKAAHYQSRVIFLGDARQHSSVEAGDFLRVLETHSPMAKFELTDIRRQTHQEYKSAIKDMAVGDARGGLAKLDALGWVKDSKAEYIRSAVGDYLRLSENGKKLDTVLAVTPTWEESIAFTSTLRGELKKHQALGSGQVIQAHEPLQWTKAQMARASNYSAGMILHFDRNGQGMNRGESAVVTEAGRGFLVVKTTRGEQRIRPRTGGFTVARSFDLEVCAGDKLLVRANDKGCGLINGETITVKEIRDGVVIGTDGRSIDTRYFAQLAHGFAVTSHRSQSKTSDHVVVAAATLDAKTAYVACSRGRKSCVLHTPDKDALMTRLPSGNRPAALDLNPARFAAAVMERKTVDREARAGLTVAALGHGWWRGLFHRVSEWSCGRLPWGQVDRGTPSNHQDINL